MMYKGKTGAFRMIALVMSFIMLITASPIISLAGSKNFSGYSIIKEKGNDDFVEYLADALSKGERRIGLGKTVKNISADVEITSALESLEGRKVKIKKKKIYLSKPTPRILGAENQNSKKRKIVFKEGTDIYVGGIDFNDSNVELIIEHNAKVEFETCSFSNTITNYGDVIFRRRCKFKTGKIANYGKIAYKGDQRERPENIAQQTGTKLKCDVFSKKFTVGQEINEKILIKTSDNKNTVIKKIGFLNGDNQITEEFKGVQLSLENDSCTMSGKPSFAGSFRVEVMVVPEGETEEIKEVLTFHVEKLYEDEDNAYCVIEENAKDGDDFKDYLNEAVEKKFQYIKLGKNIKNVSEANITQPVRYIEGAGIGRKEGKIYITGATYRAIGEKDSISKGKIVFKRGAKVDVYGIYFQNKDVEVMIEDGADVYFDRCSFSNTITNYGESYFKKCEFKTGEILDYGRSGYKKTNRPRNIAQDTDYRLISDTFSKSFEVEKEINEKIEVLTNKKKAVSIQKIGFLKEVSSDELLPKISGMKIEEKEGSYVLKGKPVTAGEYYIKITALPEGSEKSISTIFAMRVKEADILSNEYCIMHDMIKEPDDFKAYLAEAETLNSTSIRLGRDITKVSEARISPKVVLIEGNSIKHKGNQLYLSGATPRSIGTKENKEKGKIIFPKGASMAVKGIHFDSENVDVVIEEGADIYFSRCSFAHTPTNYGTAYFRKSEFKTGEIADYGTATYEKTKQPENIAQVKPKLVCSLFDKKFKVNKRFEETVEVKTDKNERVRIKEIAFLKEDNTTTSYLNGLSIMSYYTSTISGTAKVAGEYKVKIVATTLEGKTVEQIFILIVEPADIPAPKFEIDSSALENNELKGEEDKALEKKTLGFIGEDKEKAEFTAAEVYNLSGYSPVKVEDVQESLGLILAVAEDKKTVSIEGTPTAKLAKGKYKITVKAIAPGLDTPKILDVKLNITAKSEELRLVSDISQKTLRVNEKIENGSFYVKDSMDNSVTIKEIKFVVGEDKTDTVDGISLKNENGALALEGTPVKEGDYRVYVKAESKDGQSLETVFIFKVQAALPNLDDVTLVSDLSGRIFELNKKITNEGFGVKDSRGYHVEVKSLKFASNDETALDGMYIQEMDGLFAISGKPDKIGKYVIKVVAETIENQELTGEIEFEVKDEETPIVESQEPSSEPTPNTPSENDYGVIFIEPLPIEGFKTTEIADTDTPLSAGNKQVVRLKPTYIEVKIGAKKIKAKFGDEIKTAKVDVPAFIENDKVMLPVRAVATMAGFDVVWDKKERKVTLKNGENIVVISLKTGMMYINNDETGIKINPVNKKRRTFLPIKELSKALMMEIDDFRITQVK